MILKNTIHEIDQLPDNDTTMAIPKKSIPKHTIFFILSSIFLLGIITGTVVAYLTPNSQTSMGISDVTTATSNKHSQSAGVLDKKTFTDSTEGILKEGGFEGEGSHHLERGAKDQTAYLTSSTIDMSPFIGKKVKVWGQTHTSEKVGWFMDVGYIEISK